MTEFKIVFFAAMAAFFLSGASLTYQNKNIHWFIEILFVGGCVGFGLSVLWLMKAYKRLK